MRVQEKQQKQVAAAFAWSSKAKLKALTALLSYSEFRRTRAQQTIAARHHWVMTRKAGVMSAWHGLARYLAPIRTALDVMASRVSRRCFERAARPGKTAVRLVQAAVNGC